MPAEYIINEVIDVNGSITDLDAVLKEVNNFEKSIQRINQNPINIGGIASLKELREAATQLTQSLNQLNTTVSNLSKNNSSKIFQDHSKHVHEATAATQENTAAQKENLTWSQFVGQRMGSYMKIYGDHAGAIRKISEEWKEYKLTGAAAIQTINEITAAEQKQSTAAQKEKEKALAALSTKYEQALVLSKNLTDQFGAESVQAKNAAKTAADLKTKIDQLNSIQPAATTPNISAYEALKKETKEAEVNAKSLAAQFGAESKEALEAAAAYDVLRQKLELVNAVTKKKAPTAVPFDPNSIPFTSNINEANGADTINATGEAVNKLEKEYAETTNASVAFGNAQLEASAALETEASVVPEIVGALDEYTGSITQNVQAQIENSKALAVNRVEQKEILSTLRTNGALTDEQTAKLAALKTEELSLVDVNKNLTTTIRNQVKEFNSEDGSIDNLRAKLALLQQAYEGLTVAEKQSSFGVSIKEQIDVIDPALKKAEEGIGKSQRQVGGYAGAIGKALGGIFGPLRQIAYILPGIGIAGILSAALDPAMELVKSMFNLEGGIKRDTSALGEMKENLARFNDEVQKTNESLDLYFKYLDRLKDVSKVNIEVNSINVDPITKLKNELGGLQLEVSAVQQKYIEAEKEFDKTALNAGDLQNQFLNKGSKEAVAAYFNGTIESIKEGLNETDKVLYEGFVKANDAYTKSGERLADIFTLRNSALQKVQEQVKQIAKESADEQRQITRDNAVAIEEIIKSKNNAVLSNEKSSLTERLFAIKSNYAAEKAIIAANKQYVLSDPTKSSADKNAAQKQAFTELQKAEVSFQQSTFKVREEFRKRDIEADKQIFVQKKQLEIDQLKELSSNTEFGLDERVAFQKQIFETEKAIIDKEHEAKLKSVENTNLTASEKAAIETDYNDKIIKLYRSTQNEIYNIQKTSIEKLQELKQEDVERTRNIFNDISNVTSNQYFKDVEELNTSLKTKEINYDKYLKRRKKLDQDYHIATLRQTINEIEAELNAYNGAEAQFSAAQINLNTLREKLSKTSDPDRQKQVADEISVAEKTYNIAKENVEKKKGLLKDLNKTEKELGADSVTTDRENLEKKLRNAEEVIGRTVNFIAQVQSLFDNLSDARIQGYEAEKDALENRYQAEIDLINQTYVNAVDRDKALAAAKARNAAQKKVLDDKEKAENIKKAKFDKEAAIFSIILNTAKAIVSDLGTPWKIAFDAAIGAAELAVAVSQPLPKYFKGKNVDAFTDLYEGPAIVNDGGKKEAIIREDGSVEFPQKWNSIEYVGAKDIILPDANLLAWKATKSAAETSSIKVATTNMGVSREEYMYGVKNIVTAIKGQPRPKQINPKDALMRAWISSNKSWGDFFK